MSVGQEPKEPKVCPECKAETYATANGLCGACAEKKQAAIDALKAKVKELDPPLNIRE